MQHTGVSVAILVLLGTGTAAVDLSGPWGLEFRRNAEIIYVADCVWEQEGTTLTGGCTSGFGAITSVRGTVQERRVTFALTVGGDGRTEVRFAGELNAAATGIQGTWQSHETGRQTESGSFTASRR